MSALEDLFDKLPALVAKSVRDRMLLGAMASETVRELLGPFLSRYDEVMPHLAPDVQGDIVNILRLYPEIAKEYAVEPRPPIMHVLCSLWEFLERKGIPEHAADGLELDHAAEEQMPMGRSEAGICGPGSGYLLTEKGHPVLIDSCYLQDEELVHFKCRKAPGRIHVYLCGRFAFSFDRESSEAFLTLRRFVEYFSDISQCDMKIEVREEKLSS